MNEHEKHLYHWRKSLQLVVILLSIWFLVSFGAGIFLKDWLDQFTIGTAPLGFWMAQQGSIICFGLIVVCPTACQLSLMKTNLRLNTECC